mgnify:CR=1 FL=1
MPLIHKLALFFRENIPAELSDGEEIALPKVIPQVKRRTGSNSSICFRADFGSFSLIFKGPFSTHKQAIANIKTEYETLKKLDEAGLSLYLPKIYGLAYF